jgi:hypothetical protein
MSPRKATGGKAADAETTAPVRVPPKLGTQGPESGPSGEVVVDANAPGPASAAPEATSDPKAAKAQEKLQRQAENENVEREVKVRATRRGYLGHKIREEGDVFVIQLGKGEPLPSWVEAEPSAPTTPLSHSSEAREEFVDGDGTGTPRDLK